MRCPQPWCDHTEPHHHLRPMGPTWPRDMPLPYRRDYARRAGWPEDVAERWVEDPYAPEFRRRRVQRFTDSEILPPAAFRVWLASRDPADVVPPFAHSVEDWYASVPDDYSDPAEPEGEDPECE